MIDSEFKGVRKHSGSLSHTMDQWAAHLFMCFNRLAVLPHADSFGDLLDHVHKNRTLEPCRNIITGYQASKIKLREATPVFQYTMTTYQESETDETTCSVHTWARDSMHTQMHTPINYWFPHLVV